jgi:hypothetical protein
MRASEFALTESQTAKTGIMQTDVYGSRAYHARCLEPGCDWESRRYDRIQQAQSAAKKHAATHFDKKAVAEGATVTRIDSKLVTDFASGLKAYKHTDDWSQSGLDTGDDSYWKNKNLKTNTTKGLFAGDPRRTALYATGNAHETRYVEFTQNGQPIVYFDQKDLPAMRSRKTYLTVFDASNFRQLPTGEWFSKNPGKPIKQVPIGDPFKYIASQGWIVRVTDDLDKVFKQVQKMHKAGKIPYYGAEGMNESKQGVAEGLDSAEKISGLVDIPAFTPSGVAKVVNTGDRIMAVMNVKGVNIPLYISTGQGGKASVATGKWYPVFGVDPSTGWLNKGGEASINKFYGSKILALAAARLNNTLGDLSNVEDKLPAMKRSGQSVINKDLQPMGYSEAAANPDEFKKRVNSFLAKLGEGPFYPVDNPKEQSVAENFADGRKPGRKGLAKRVGVDCKQPVSKLRSIAKNSSGERQRMAHWCANMKAGRKK